MIVELIGELLLEGLFHLTGRVLVRALSLGRLRAGEFEPAGPKRRRYAPVCHQDGWTYVDPDVVTIVGLLFWVAFIVVAFLVGRRLLA